ncbi:MAG: cytochrome C, partial [Nitrospinota bacterium]
MNENIDEKRFGLMAEVAGESNLTAKNPDDCVPTWPNLVYRELICMILVMSLLLLLSLLFRAPLEGMANPAVTPNPAKAPWYFVGLQEILHYFDPWIAGVIIPGATMLGLMCIPYIDPNRKGTGEYNLKVRPYAWMFVFAYAMWFALIFVGRFMRGPSWLLYWPWEAWDIHRVAAAHDINLSELLRIPSTIPWVLREIPGMALLLLHFVGIPLIMNKRMKGPYQSLGIIR